MKLTVDVKWTRGTYLQTYTTCVATCKRRLLKSIPTFHTSWHKYTAVYLNYL